MSTTKHKLKSLLSCLVVTLSLLPAGFTSGQLCNSNAGLCPLRYDQVSFAGTHNSGSGFDGSLKRCDGTVENGCIWQNQNLSITDQLNLGIRFLEIDTCLLPEECNNSVYGDLGNSTLFTCYGRGSGVSMFRFAGPITRLFQQVNDWMVANPSEVIGIYFPDDSPDGQATQIFPELRRLLKSMWLHESSDVYMSSYYNNNSEWPTLSEAIRTNERIFVFIDNGLLVNQNPNETFSWNNPAPASTYVKPSQESNFCRDPLAEHVARCNTSAEIVLEAAFTLGVCIKNGQDDCNVFLPNATRTCYDLRTNYQRTVNVIQVDYPERDGSTIFQAIEVLNAFNIEQYSPATTTPTDDITGVTSSGTSTYNISMGIIILSLIVLTVSLQLHCRLQ